MSNREFWEDFNKNRQIGESEYDTLIAMIDESGENVHVKICSGTDYCTDDTTGLPRSSRI